MGYPRAEQVTLVIDEHLGLVGQPAEGIGMNDAIAVALKLAAVLRRWFGITAAARVCIVRGIDGQTGAGHPKCAASVSRSAASG